MEGIKSIKLKDNTKALETFIKKANHKLVELDVLQSIWEIKSGKGKIYNSSADFMKHIKSKLS
ncbi:MAG: hypothetical protein HYT69_01900 [Candidatus Zambryskibacteria bacterium]|nr:hypothetical protein [Candidatus Zambryskibacteria bacterium]